MEEIEPEVMEKYGFFYLDQSFYTAFFPDLSEFCDFDAKTKVITFLSNLSLQMRYFRSGPRCSKLSF